MTRPKDGRARYESPGTTRHQTWPAPPVGIARTSEAILTGTPMARDRGLICISPMQHGLDPVGQFAPGEGLGHIGIGTQIKPDRLVNAAAFLTGPFPNDTGLVLAPADVIQISYERHAPLTCEPACPRVAVMCRA
jgi:hypothetical protein